MRNPKKALLWIKQIIEKHKVPYQVVGGLAAIAYGSGRELADIDIEIPGKHFGRIMPDVKEHVVSGPERYKDENWDLVYMRIKYEGMDIELTDADNTWIHDQGSMKWVKEKIDFSESIMMGVLGHKVPVIPKKRLIAYKRKLGREVDLMDIEQISTNHNI